MTKNITVSAGEALIEAARAQGTTLHEPFRLWLEQYARQRQVQKFEEFTWSRCRANTAAVAASSRGTR